MRIGIVDDPRRAELLKLAILLSGEHEVVWIADGASGVEAQCAAGIPDLVLVNLDLPAGEGLTATRVLARAAGAAVLLTAAGQADPARVFEAIGHGALEVVSLEDAVFPEAIAAALLPKIAAVSRWLGKQDARGTVKIGRAACPHLIAIGASAGGPAALSVVLGGLPRTLQAGVVVVQHLGEDFTPGVAEWLRRSTPLEVRVARDGDSPAAGTVLVAGGNDHLVFTAAGRLGYTAEPRDKIYRPSIDVFFESVCRLWRSPALGVLLTGMGRDGAQGLHSLRAKGHHTIAQDEATSAVYGMPKAAAALNAAVDILPLDEIARRIVEIVVARPTPRSRGACSRSGVR